MDIVERLQNLKFGSPAAERDINQGLKTYFYKSDSYKKLRSGTKTVVLGNRGAGKSAIFKMLAEEKKAENHIVVELAPEDYSYEILTQALACEI